MLGFSHTYESWWFIGLLVMIGTSLVICSLDRVLPLYRALNKQQIRKHLQFLIAPEKVYTGSVRRTRRTAWPERLADAAEAKRTAFTCENGRAAGGEKPVQPLGAIHQSYRSHHLPARRPASYAFPGW